MVFEITPSGSLTTLCKFCSQTNCTDGFNPDAGLVLGVDGNFYGTTYYGGANFSGTPRQRVKSRFLAKYQRADPAVVVQFEIQRDFDKA